MKANKAHCNKYYKSQVDLDRLLDSNFVFSSYGLGRSPIAVGDCIEIGIDMCRNMTFPLHLILRLYEKYGSLNDSYEPSKTD